MSSVNDTIVFVENKVSDENAFSIMEILIAVSIFAIGLLAVASLLITASRGNRVGNSYSTATILAQRQIEALKSVKSTDFESDPADVYPTLMVGVYPDNPHNTNPIDENGDTGGIFTRTWTIVANTTFSRLVTVTVSWNNGSVVMSTVTRGDGN
jgi:type IV pilus assembly protein PilV